MASPLILRITSKFDNTGTKQAQQDFRGLESSINRTSRAVAGSQDAFERMTAELAGTRIITAEASKNFGDVFGGFLKSIKTVRGVMRLFKTALIVEAFVVAPITAFIKKSEEVEKALLPVVTRLNQLGQAGEFQGQRLKNFAETLQRTTGVSTKETIQSLDILISKTRTTADAEQIINAAQKIRLGTGQKLTDVTKALAEAQTGNAASLAAITGRTEQEINALARSGQLVQELDKAFSEAAQRGLSTFSAQLGVLSKRVAQSIFDVTKAQLSLQSLAEKIGGPTAGLAAGLGIGIQKNRKQVEELQKLLDKTLFSTQTPDLRSFESLQIAAGKAADEVRRIQSALATGRNLSSTQKQDLEDILQVRQQELALLDEQIRKEVELSSAQRQILVARTRALELQNSLLVQQQAAPGSESNQKALSDQRKRLRAEIEEAQKANILIEAQEEARNIFLTKKREATSEELADIETRATEKILQQKLSSFREEQQIENARLQRLQALKQAQVDLQSFQLQNRVGKFSGISSEEELDQQDKIDKKRIELAVLNAQKERDSILAERQLTREDAERIETELQLKISTIREEAAQRRARREVELSKLSVSERKKLEEDAEKQRSLVDSFRTGARKTEKQFDFEIDTDKILAKARTDLSTSTETKGLKEELKNILTPEQTQVTNIVSALEASIREKKLQLNISLLQDRGQTQQLAQDIGALISNEIIAAIQRRMSPQAIIQRIISGADQGGSES